MSDVNLKNLFHGLQAQMNAKLSTNRGNITHPGSKGDALENAWIEWLRDYLPNRYSVDKAIVIDHEGSTSQQIDIVIYDNWFTPFIFTQNGFHYIPAEGVYAIFEVKPDIDGNINYAAEKIESVRKLKRTSTEMISSGRQEPARPLTKIIGGIICSSSRYSKNNNNDAIRKALEKENNLRSIDMGCIADYTSFYVEYTPKEKTEEKNLEKRIERYYEDRRISKVIFSNEESALVTFFLQLLHYLQQSIGTIPAIDLSKYAKAVDFTLGKEL